MSAAGVKRREMGGIQRFEDIVAWQKAPAAFVLQ
jgi:hypothetical protein